MAFQGIGQTDDSKVTGTAAWLSSLCAILSKDPDYGAVLNDPYAVYFAENFSEEAKSLLSQYDDAEYRRNFIREHEEKSPGRVTVVAYRKPEMERLTRKALSESQAKQLVILGVGCDTLSLRLARDKIVPRVFEIDRPGVIDYRISVLKKIQLDVSHINSVAVDFDHEDFGDVLLSTGYKSDEPTVFFAEGLLGYLEPKAVTAIFKFVRTRSAPGSRFVFSFTDRRRSDNPNRIPVQAELDQQGESVKFDLAPEQLAQFVDDHELELDCMISAKNMRNNLAPRLGVPVHILPFLHLACVRVPG